MIATELNEQVDYQSPYDRNGQRTRDWTSGCVRHVSNITTTIDLPPVNDVIAVYAHAKTKDDWDGVSAAILQLSGGRWMTWESWWGPTGSGFSEDAYGGDADVWIADSLDDAIRLGLTDDGRRLLGVAP